MKYLPLIALFCAISALANGGSIATPPPKAISSSQWHFTIAPYGWIFGMKGDMTIKGNTSDLDVTPLDVIKSLNKVDAIFQLHMEAGKGRWSFMFDPTYLKLTQDGSMGPLSVSVTPSILLIDFGAFYSLATHQLSQSFYSPLTFQAFAGGRYFEMKARINPQRLPNQTQQQSFTTPIIGARLINRLGQHVYLILRGDYGGFGIDGVKNTWSTSLLAQYAFTQHIALALGFRALGIDYSNGSGANRFAVDTRFYGPVLGFVFRL